MKLKKFLINRHIHKLLRDMLPLIVKDNDILAICGLEIDRSLAADPGMDNCLRIIWEPGDIFCVAT
jgi:hypothetical protein